MKNWAAKQLDSYGIKEIVESKDIANCYDFRQLQTDLRIVGITKSKVNEVDQITVIAIGRIGDEERKLRISFLQPALPRVKNLNEILDGHIKVMSNYAQVKSSHRNFIGCYAKIEKTDGKSFNLSTNFADKTPSWLKETDDVTLLSKGYKSMSAIDINYVSQEELVSML